MDATLKSAIRNRAGNRCEYCRLPQSAVDATFHVDHVIAQQHVDETGDDLESLALACDRCNFHKGTNLSSVDPASKSVVSLFHPLRDIWEDHFVIQNDNVIGLTATGRATVRLLQMNSERRVQLRRLLRS